MKFSFHADNERNWQIGCLSLENQDWLKKSRPSEAALNRDKERLRNVPSFLVGPGQK